MRNFRERSTLRSGFTICGFRRESCIVAEMGHSSTPETVRDKTTAV